MTHRAAIINLVALTDEQLSDMPRLAALCGGGSRSRLQPQFPAVTCTSQTTMLTGVGPSTHGIVGNGWHDRDTSETHFWQQSDRLVQSERVWDRLRAIDPAITTANCFWWYAMYAHTDVSITPRPMYPADGRKIPDIWTSPGSLRDALQSTLGRFPLFHFWGPGADISSSKWIADAALHVNSAFDPTPGRLRKQVGIVALFRRHDVPTVEEVGDHMGIPAPTVLGLDVEHHTAIAEISIEARQHRALEVPQRIQDLRVADRRVARTYITKSALLAGRPDRDPTPPGAQLSVYRVIDLESERGRSTRLPGTPREITPAATPAPPPNA